MVKRDDLNVQEITVTNPGDTNAVSVALPTRYNIILVTLGSDLNPYYVNLPSDDDSEVGDYVEFYVVNRAFDGDPGGTLHINDSAGVQFYPSRGPLLVASGPEWKVCVRKVAAGVWR